MKRKSILTVSVITVLLVISIIVLLNVVNKGEKKLIVSGRIEADEVLLSPKFAGRLVEVFVSDGSEVRKGEIIATLEDSQLRSKHRELKAKIDALSDRVQSAELELDFTENNVKHDIEVAKNSLAIAEAQLRQAKDRQEIAAKELDRYSALLDQGVVTSQQYDKVHLESHLAREETISAGQELRRARASLDNARASRSVVKARRKEIDALRNSVTQVREEMEQIEISLDDTKITAPVAGIILRKVAEAGEVVSTGSVIAVMIDPLSIYAKTYIPEKYLGMIRYGMAVQVLTDAYPGKPFKGSVCFLSDRSEFTPKEVQTREERVKQVYAVKVCFPEETVAGHAGAERQMLKKGMPVDLLFPVSID